MQSEEERLEQAVSSSNRSGDPQAVDDSERMGVPTSVYSSVYEDGVSVRITAVRGRGFSIKKRRFGKKDDVPDLYCVIRLVKVNDANQQKEIDIIKSKLQAQENLHLELNQNVIALLKRIENLEENK